MCCCAEFIVKYVLIIANVIFALAGLVILGLGIAVHIQIKEIGELIPVNLNALSVGIILIGCAVFVISYLACCGAIKESRCMLIFYTLFMSILAGIKIYLAVIIFNFLDNVQSTVQRWIVSAFNNLDLRPPFHVMEQLFQCCGTTGSGSYAGISATIPPSCCGNPVDSQCLAVNSYSGCVNKLAGYFDTFGEAIGIVLIGIIIIEIVCVLFGLFMCCQIRKKRYVGA